MNVKKMQTMNKRKSMDTTGDPYILKSGNSEMTVCKKCHAIYRNKRWYMDEELYQKKILSKSTEKTLCPACKKIKHKFPGGIVLISGNFIKDHMDEIMNLIRNEEERARGFNPLERIIGITTSKTGVEISTTNEKLAQRIARSLEKAYQGDVAYKWSDDTKLLRAQWSR